MMGHAHPRRPPPRRGDSRRRRLCLRRPRRRAGDRHRQARALRRPDRHVSTSPSTRRGRRRSADSTSSLEQNGKQSQPLFSLAQPAGASLTQDGADRVRLTRGIGKADVPDLKAGDGAHRRHRGAAGVPAACARSRRAPRRRAGAARAAARRGRSRRITTSTSAAPRWSSTARRRPTSQSGVRVGDVEYPGFPAVGRRRGQRRSGAARRVLRAALRPGPQHADARVRAR